jgi:hypothetical protein
LAALSKLFHFGLDRDMADDDIDWLRVYIMASRRIIPLTFILAALLAWPAFAQGTLGMACEPYGSVTIKGEPAADGMLVIAYVGDIELARSHTEGGQYSLYIDPDDADTPQREGYQPGDIINLRVNGNPAEPAFEAFAGRLRRDIEVTVLVIQLETWGRIKALFR